MLGPPKEPGPLSSSLLHLEEEEGEGEGKAMSFAMLGPRPQGQVPD